MQTVHPNNTSTNFSATAITHISCQPSCTTYPISHSFLQLTRYSNTTLALIPFALSSTQSNHYLASSSCTISNTSNTHTSTCKITENLKPHWPTHQYFLNRFHILHINIVPNQPIFTHPNGKSPPSNQHKFTYSTYIIFIKH